ncbi:pilus assembly protein TadG-related protein [Tabrizicola sp. BL-A-41-H6]|uniref:pilus assembly protein TadG-related protein n=1 Tax=Tabrizicola sp. BL-A-41-H6 TaxID=3421107 RepID=UPI003D663E5C
MKTIAAASVAARERISLYRFYNDERGVMAFFMLAMFLLMLMFGGIAVDVMRYETRRVALQQTMDRAALASASLKQGLVPKAVFDDYFAKANLGDGVEMVDFATPTVVVDSNSTYRKVEASAKVTSYNFFMHMMDVDTLESVNTTSAQQGVSQIEVILVLDVSGSMGNSDGSGSTKIAALRASATKFVTTIKNLDTFNQVSIGIVPYNAQVNIPANLRQQYTVTNVATYDGVPNAGFPNANCVEIPQSSYSTTALSRTTPMPMMAVADTVTSVSTTTNFLALSSAAPVDNPGNRSCNPTTANRVSLPSLNATTIRSRISALTHGGNTSIAIGMRWGVALLDQSARPIYSALITEPEMAGRPADNTSTDTRKIIVLMTDGENVATDFVPDAYKTGPSPIWRGQDGNYAIQFTTGGTALTNTARPSCAGTNTYFVNHLKTNTTTNCQSAAWRATPAWTGSGTAVRLDWSEVWRYLSISYVTRQLYGRSNTGISNTTLMNMFRTTYIPATTLDSLLASNCAAAKTAGIEIYGIAFAAPAIGQTVINNCASSPKTNYYFNSTNGTALDAAFQQIATNISELRLTQ